MGLALRNLLFTIVVPGSRWGVRAMVDPDPRRHPPEPRVWPAILVVAIGAALYFWCLSLFAVVGRGTSGPWDAPRRVVAVGPYRWVRHKPLADHLVVVHDEDPQDRWVSR